MTDARKHTNEHLCFGFTLLELVVVLFIVSIIASLSLTGLAGARQRGKIDKTRSTIRKIHDLVVPHYESYVRRRVPMGGASGPQGRLVRMRQLVMFEMPDSWEDVAISGTTAVGNLMSSGTVPAFAWNGVTRAYGAYHEAMVAKSGSGFRTTFPSSECLYMIVSGGLGEPDAMEQFRADEIGDVDGDSAPEFIDGWDEPIAFIRWPIGFQSPIQSQDASIQPDPFDPFRVSTLVAYPGASQQDYAVTPLIVSGGPDGASSEYGVAFAPLSGWHPALIGSTPSLTLRVIGDPNDVPGYRKAPDLAADNITNHDLLSK